MGSIDNTDIRRQWKDNETQWPNIEAHWARSHLDDAIKHVGFALVECRKYSDFISVPNDALKQEMELISAALGNLQDARKKLENMPKTTV